MYQVFKTRMTHTHNTPNKFHCSLHQLHQVCKWFFLHLKSKGGCGGTIKDIDPCDFFLSQRGAAAYHTIVLGLPKSKDFPWRYFTVAVITAFFSCSYHFHFISFHFVSFPVSSIPFISLHFVFISSMSSGCIYCNRKNKTLDSGRGLINKGEKYGKIKFINRGPHPKKYYKLLLFE